ncbi:NADAR domain-containing protein [Mycobacteroides franklinii]|uniref:NADAR domain-containing protein n=1 Tax=Mycobacteroides franklinii TaxID=948102 RepID=A0A4R8R2L1_9MYCO|nr:NADAR domain-containing protein [Mycobacteroides franklinii]TDZ43251.1 hypothetical protein CCUG64054_03305 [Mycobacteroides franklinii]TDZ50386.1 hypothetical protein CCUG63697_01891 [Mycobacteroides franklinii]TDZ56806.1 hypothetical protein CCUG63696_03307 [Mycobacteroides franklinii]TDZ63747.1 hypothetical protein CCUG63695_03232 [Mycobacteroides franklinii]TDZ70144.1 hypothetical protein CCUG64056_03305 [Mycobacteroides franklinii]
MGRQVVDFDETVWETSRYEAGVAGNLAKFSQNSELRDYLCDTGERVLAEASPVGRVWGIGMTADDPRVGDPTR